MSPLYRPYNFGVLLIVKFCKSASNKLISPNKKMFDKKKKYKLLKMDLAFIKGLILQVNRLF